MSVWPPQGTDVSIRPPRVPTLAKGPHLSGYSKGEHLVLGKSIAHDMKSGAEGAHFLGALLLTFSFDKHSCNERAEELRHDFQSKRLSEYVWEEQGQILALLSIGDTADIDKKGAFEIWRIYVRPEAQGHNIGSKCILFAEQEAKRQGYQEIVIWAFQENTTAISFYQKNGYVIDKNEYLGEPYLTFGIRLIKTLM